MSDTPQLLLAHHLKALRLPTFLREYDIKRDTDVIARGVFTSVKDLARSCPPVRCRRRRPFWRS
jgi:hypothetical protein